MATIVNNPTPADNTMYRDRVVYRDDVRERSGIGWVLGLILAVLLGLLLLNYLIPAIRNNSSTGVNVPDKINVDVNPSSGTTAQ